VLTNLPTVTNLKIDNTLVEFEFSSSADDAAQLLARLINSRVPVSSFSQNAPDLEEAYLRTGITQWTNGNVEIRISKSETIEKSENEQ